ncbi:MAG: hypothetical protein V1493_00535 [Candidatus Diapherotrites archaeon]
MRPGCLKRPGEKGMFWPFRLLIAALVSLVVLTMILATISYFDQYKAKVSWQRFVDAFDSAHNAITTPDNPDKGLKKEDGLSIQKTTLSSTIFAKSSNLQAECITFQAPENSPVKILNDGRTAALAQDIVSTVYFLCIYDKTAAECTEHCYISFGIRPQTE